ncbi:hypothetical protein PMAYCL1PPCAC_14153, partial [Pristionchus mayeri]
VPDSVLRKMSEMDRKSIEDLEDRLKRGSYERKDLIAILREQIILGRGVILDDLLHNEESLRAFLLQTLV